MPPAARTALRALSIAGWALLVCLTLPDKSPSLLSKWPWPVFHQLLLAFPALWLALSAAATPLAAPGLTRSATIVLASFGCITTAAAVLSPFNTISIEWLSVRIAPLFLIVAIARAVASSEKPEDVSLAIARTIAATLAALCLVSLAWWAAADCLGGWQRASESGRELPLSHFLAIRNVRPLGHSNYTAGVAILALGWTASLAAVARGPLARAWIAGAVIALLTLFSSGSRGGWIGLGVLAIAATLIVLRRRGVGTARIAAAVVVVAVASVAVASFHPRTRALIENFRATGGMNQGDVQRYAMAHAALLMAKDRPILGYGPGTIPNVYPRYREQLEGGVETALQLHSTTLQVLATTGIAGLAAITALTLLVLLQFVRATRAARLDETACAGLAFVGYAAFALTDYQLDVPIIAGAAAATAGVALATTGGSPRTQTGGFVTGIVSLLWLLAVLWTQWTPMVVRAKFSSAIDALERSDTEVFLRRSMEAIDMPHADPRLKNITALILANPQAYGVSAQPDPQAAIDLLERSLAINPDQEIAHFNLGWLLLASDPVRAAGHFQEAARLVPDKGGVYLGMGFTLLGRGQPDAALDVFAIALVNNPRMISSPIWNAPILAERWAGAVTRAAAVLDGLDVASLSERQVRSARYTASLFRWIAGDDAQLSAAIENAEPQAKRFLESVPSTTPSTSRSPQIQAWNGPDNWRAVFLPVHADAQGSQMRRTAYALVMRDADMPVPIDLYTSIENTQVARALPFVFPPKGWLTGPQLRMLLGED